MEALSGSEARILAWRHMGSHARARHSAARTVLPGGAGSHSPAPPQAADHVCTAAFRISRFVSDARSWSKPPSSGAQEQNSLIRLTSFITKDTPMLPRLNRRRAQFVLTKSDEILAWEQRKEAEKDTRFVELGRYLC